MNILILNTSFSRPFTCLVKQDEKGCQIVKSEDNCDIKHSEDTLKLVDSLCEKMNVKIQDVDVVAVNVGPGSFTGIRVGVSIAKGLICANNKAKCVSFSSLEQVLELCGQSTALIRANEDELYFGRVENKEVNLGIAANNEMSGFEYTDEVSYDRMIEASVSIVLSKIKNIGYCSLNELVPIYLKLSQAERELIEKEKLKNDK